ncbi:MAG: FKBP-type peptidyl-prolyl cis-trans isomerase, partial [Halothiobacillus sp.]
MTIPRIARGDTITLHYALRLPDDRLVDSSFDAEPLTFVLGDGSFEPRLEEALIGLALGEHTRLLLTPEYAFGTPDPEMIHELARREVPDHLALKLNDVVEFNLPNGDAIAGTLRAINEETL